MTSRVHGARENNLKEVSIEIPKRRLTVFTRRLRLGQGSLVFDAIAAESQRMINETSSAFVQGFAHGTTGCRHLEGLTTAIIVDQERMGSNPRSTVGTATDANAMLRILFESARPAVHRIVPGVLLQHRLHQRSRCVKLERGGGDREGAAQLPYHRRHVSTLRGHGLGHRFRPFCALWPPVCRSTRVRSLSPDTQHGRLVRPDLQRLGFFDPDKPIGKYTQKELTTWPAKTDRGQDQGREDQPDVRGPDPRDPEVLPFQGSRRDAAADQHLSSGGDGLLPVGLRRYPAQ